MLDKPLLYLRLFFWALRILAGDAQRSLKAAWTRRQALLLGSSAPESRDRNIVIVGANFAGYHAAKLLSTALSPHSRYRVVVIEPNSHFQFTWVLPRFCVAPGHEDKAFVPYGGNVAGAPEGALRWVRDRVVEVTRTGVRLRDSDEEIPYEYLVIATGAQVKEGLPTRVNAEDKREGMKLLQAMQARIEAATRIVVVGGGAAGVELATDAQCKYPDKKVTLIHSRGALMHRFGKGLQEASLAAMEKLGGEVILNERVVGEDASAGTVTLQSGRVIECDCFVSLQGTGWSVVSLLLTWVACPDQRHGTKAGVRRPGQARARRHLEHGTHQGQAHAAARRRHAAQHLRLRRRGRHQRAEPKLPLRDPPGEHRGGQPAARGQGQAAAVYVRAGLVRGRHIANAWAGKSYTF